MSRHPGRLDGRGEPPPYFPFPGALGWMFPPGSPAAMAAALGLPPAAAAAHMPAVSAAALASLQRISLPNMVYRPPPPAHVPVGGGRSTRPSLVPALPNPMRAPPRQHRPAPSPLRIPLQSRPQAGFSLRAPMQQRLHRLPAPPARSRQQLEAEMREMAELEAQEMASFEAEEAEEAARCVAADRVSQVMGIQLPKELQITVVQQPRSRPPPKLNPIAVPTSTSAADLVKTAGLWRPTGGASVLTMANRSRTPLAADAAPLRVPLYTGSREVSVTVIPSSGQTTPIASAAVHAQTGRHAQYGDSVVHPVLGSLVRRLPVPRANCSTVPVLPAGNSMPIRPPPTLSTGSPCSANRVQAEGKPATVTVQAPAAAISTADSNVQQCATPCDIPKPETNKPTQAVDFCAGDSCIPTGTTDVVYAKPICKIKPERTQVSSGSPRSSSPVPVKKKKDKQHKKDVILVDSHKMPVGASKMPVGASKMPVGASKMPVGASKMPVGAIKMPVGASKLGNGTMPKIPTLRITKNKDDEYSVQRAGSPHLAAVAGLDHGAPTESVVSKNSDQFYTFDVDESVHVRASEDQRPRYVCDICQIAYQRLHSLKRHRYRTHINHRYVHESDMASAELISLLDTSGFRQMTDADPSSQYPFLYCCYQCKTLYDNLPAVVQHQRAAHQGRPRDVVPGTKKLGCDKCEETFANKKDLEKHREVHECQTFACKFCDQVFPCESVKKRHEKIHSRESRAAEPSGSQQTIAKINIGGVKISVGIGNLQQLKKFQEACKEMSETSNGTISLESADLEALEQLEERPRSVFPCAVCDKSFPSYKRMCCHMRMAHPHKPIPSKANSATRSSYPSTEQQLDRQRAAGELKFYSGVASNVADNLSNYLDGVRSTLPGGALQQPPDVKPPTSPAADVSDVKPPTSLLSAAPDVKPSMSPSVAAPEESVERSVHLLQHQLDMTSQLRMRLAASVQRETVNLCVAAGQESRDCNLPQLLGLVSADGAPRLLTHSSRPSWLPEEQGAAASYSARMQPAAGAGDAPLAGEWQRLSCFVCHACGAVYDSLFELDEHQQHRHPHVMCGHTSLPDDARLLHDDVCEQYAAVSAGGSAAAALRLSCTSCQRQCHSAPELHRHLLECAGDTDWNTWNTPRKRRWRRFGTRRRRRFQSRRGVKRLLPTPTARAKQQTAVKTKPNRDTAADSIEKMLANLPAKRVSKQLFPMLNLVQLQKRHKASVTGVTGGCVGVAGRVSQRPSRSSRSTSASRAASPSAVEEASVASPSAVEETSVVSPSAVEETSVASPSAVEETSVASPNAVEETSVASPSAVEETSVASPSAVEETSVASPSAFEETSVTAPPSLLPCPASPVDSDADSAAVVKCESPPPEIDMTPSPAAAAASFEQPPVLQRECDPGEQAEHGPHTNPNDSSADEAAQEPSAADEQPALAVAPGADINDGTDVKPDVVKMNSEDADETNSTTDAFQDVEEAQVEGPSMVVEEDPVKLEPVVSAVGPKRLGRPPGVRGRGQKRGLCSENSGAARKKTRTRTAVDKRGSRSASRSTAPRGRPSKQKQQQPARRRQLGAPVLAAKRPRAGEGTSSSRQKTADKPQVTAFNATVAIANKKQALGAETAKARLKKLTGKKNAAEGSPSRSAAPLPRIVNGKKADRRMKGKRKSEFNQADEVKTKSVESKLLKAVVLPSKKQAGAKSDPDYVEKSAEVKKKKVSMNRLYKKKSDVLSSKSSASVETVLDCKGLLKTPSDNIIATNDIIESNGNDAANTTVVSDDKDSSDCLQKAACDAELGAALNESTRDGLRSSSAGSQVSECRKRVGRAAIDETDDDAQVAVGEACDMFTVSMTTNRTRTVYTCKKCCQKLYRLATLEKHIQKCCDMPEFSLCAMMEASGDADLECSLCGHAFTSEQHLDLHVTACHRRADAHVQRQRQCSPGSHEVSSSTDADPVSSSIADPEPVSSSVQEPQQGRRPDGACELGVQCDRCQRLFLSQARLVSHQHRGLCQPARPPRQDRVSKKESLFSLLHNLKRELHAASLDELKHAVEATDASLEQIQMIWKIVDKFTGCVCDRETGWENEIDKKRYLRVRLLERVRAVAETRERGEDNMDTVLLGLNELMSNDDVLRFLRETPGRGRNMMASMERDGLLGLVGQSVSLRMWADGQRSPRRAVPLSVTRRSPRPASVIQTMRNNFNLAQEQQQSQPPPAQQLQCESPQQLQLPSPTDPLQEPDQLLCRLPDESPPCPPPVETASCTGLGAIMSCVNSVLEDDSSNMSSLSSQPSQLLADSRQQLPDFSGDPALQLAMGVTDEEMSMLERLGSCQQQDLVYDNSADGSGPAPLAPPLAPPQCELTRRRDLEQQHGEFECFICDRRFRGRDSLTQHLMWQHRASQEKIAAKTSTLQPLQIVSEQDRCRSCFVCGEMIRDPLLLNLHIARAHIRRRSGADVGGGLKTQMSTALGGLFDKAINNMLGRAASRLSASSGQTAIAATGPLPPTTDTSTGCMDAVGGSGCSYVCDVCNQRFMKAGALARHVQSVHLQTDRQPGGNTGPGLVVCPVCDEAVPVYGSLNLSRHLKLLHKQWRISLDAVEGQLKFICLSPDVQTDTPVHTAVVFKEMPGESVATRGVESVARGVESVEDSTDSALTVAESTGPAESCDPETASGSAEVAEDSTDFMCSECGIGFSTPRKVLAHMECAHASRRPPASLAALLVDHEHRDALGELLHQLQAPPRRGRPPAVRRARRSRVLQPALPDPYQFDEDDPSAAADASTSAAQQQLRTYSRSKTTTVCRFVTTTHANTTLDDENISIDAPSNTDAASSHDTTQAASSNTTPSSLSLIDPHPPPNTTLGVSSNTTLGIPSSAAAGIDSNSLAAHTAALPVGTKPASSSSCKAVPSNTVRDGVLSSTSTDEPTDTTAAATCTSPADPSYMDDQSPVSSPACSPPAAAVDCDVVSGSNSTESIELELADMDA